jgi:hypothetical protein
MKEVAAFVRQPPAKGKGEPIESLGIAPKLNLLGTVVGGTFVLYRLGP